MSPTPRGWIEPTARGRDLTLTRTFSAPIEDVWASITTGLRTAQWFASWTGDARPGAVIRCRLVFEEGDAETEATIDACEPPRHGGRLRARAGAGTRPGSTTRTGLPR